jgi:thioredoxin-dependent peroxiredoxin
MAAKTARTTAKKAPGKGAKKAAKRPVGKPAAKAKIASKPSSKSGTKTAAAKAPKGAATTLAVGAKAPKFSLAGDGGSTIALDDFAGRKLVVYFYPKANTSGCTIEAMDFSRLKDAFAKTGTDIVGVSADSVKALDGFKEKRKLTIPLASDPTRKMLEAFGVWQEKSLYGRKFFGIVRSTFLIGADQRVARVWPKVTVAGHAAQVLEAAKAL